MAKLHQEGKFGGAARLCSNTINQIIARQNISHLLDYGCGKKLILSEHLTPVHGFRYQAYDPGVKKYAGLPVPAELVVACDVLEHIEPECIDDVLDHLEELTEVILYLSVSTRPAKKTLSDGRNAHLIQQPMEWWLPQIWERFTIQTYQAHPDGFVVIANNSMLEIVDDNNT